jgi:hypothetical protein
MWMNPAGACVRILLGAVALASSPARAGIPLLFDGGPPEGNGSGIETTIRVLANDFVLPQAGSVETVEFWATASTWDGTLEYFFFEDAGNVPAAVPLASGDGANVRQTPTGVSGEFVFFFDLEAPLPLPAGPRYWLGLHLKQGFADDGNYSFWSTTTTDFGLTSASAEGGDFGAWGLAPDDEAFRLYGPVPEPAGAFQALAGAALLVAAGRRRGARRAQSIWTGSRSSCTWSARGRRSAAR